MAAPLTATAINCSLSAEGRKSSTDAMIAILTEHFTDQDVTVSEPIRIATHNVKWGVRSDEGDEDEWPTIRARIPDPSPLTGLIVLRRFNFNGYISTPLKCLHEDGEVRAITLGAY